MHASLESNRFYKWYNALDSSGQKADLMVETEVNGSTIKRVDHIKYLGILKEGHFNRRSHGGVGIYFHESAPFKEINLTSPLQAVAIRQT